MNLAVQLLLPLINEYIDTCIRICKITNSVFQKVKGPSHIVNEANLATALDSRGAI